MAMAKTKLARRNSLFKALQRSISWPNSSSSSSSSSFSSSSRLSLVPKDVKEGQFAVVAVWGEKATRFVVSLSCLSNPLFLRLLEMAEEEFGFENRGAIALPCQPNELERIIREMAV
ncbi:auxin-induced protein 6B-like [Canna indica]|uniref:Auxin-induced protein 6B-like n=1 Tax=Canna indica TaxID=4628 RepID=A0AAQ3QJ87_9LILI|nr:auxin-induced protein 6B-like [Canna indica]